MPLAKANGVDLFYDLTGPEGAPLVAFSNSLGTTLEMWDPQVRALAERARCLRYDTRGHGRSAVVEAPATIDDLAADLAGLLDALGVERAHVVGLSLGGMTGQAFAARYPAKVDKLVLMATAAVMGPPSTWDARAAAVRRDGMGAVVDAVMQRWFTPDFAGDARARTVHRQILATDPRGYAAACEVIRDMDLRGRLPTITAPTLVVAGADDPSTPVAKSEEIVAGIPGANLVVVPHAAHLLNVQQPDFVTEQLIAFLGLAEPADGAARFERGLANRKAVLGVDHVQRSLARAGGFAMPWQDFITRTAWGEVWGDDTLPWKTRSLVTLAMMVALGREEEFKLHVRPALKNGVSVEELRALLIQAAVYAGVPAANGAFRWVGEVLGDEID